MENEKAMHIILDFDFESYPEQLETIEFWEKFGAEVLAKGKMTLLGKTFHKFEPQGISGFWLLSESHFSFHTWPEIGKICLDLFSCGKAQDTFMAAEETTLQLEKLGGRVSKRQDIERGFVTLSK